LIKGTIDLLAQLAQAKAIEMILLVEDNMFARLRQVITNLVGNAIKFTACGKISILVAKESETPAHVIIRTAVSDTGIGIDEAGKQHLFQAFTQADGSSTRKYGGTGLGLAIFKQLVELMDGKIGVKSSSGQCSNFGLLSNLKNSLNKPAPYRLGKRNFQRI
jgi:signal transduction histidine kinase